MLIKFLIFHLLTFLVVNAFAECPYGTNEGQSLEGIFGGCREAEIVLKADPDYEINYKKYINNKLASIVAKQSQQILEDLAATSGFYENVGKSFFISNSGAGRVSSSCRFDFVKAIETKGCKKEYGAETNEKAQEKLKMLASALGGDQAHSLWGSILDVYSANKVGYSGDLGGNKCPLQGSALPLMTQITESSAKDIIDAIQKQEDKNIKSLYDFYPQLALVKNAGLKDDFEKYIRGFKSDSSKGKDQTKIFLSNFFHDPKNSAALENGVSDKCEQMSSSIKRFICQPLDKILPSKKDTAKKLLDKYDISKEYVDQREVVKQDPYSYKTYAYLCMEKKKSSLASAVKVPLKSKADKNKDTCTDYLLRESTVDDYYNCFDSGTRPQVAKSEQDNRINSFCNRYNCKLSDDEVSKIKLAQIPMCNPPGPISLAELQELAKITPEISNELAFIETLRTRQDISFQTASSIASNTSEPSKKKLNLSAFDLNAFGADAVMKLEHIPVTTETTSIVAQEMKDKGIEPELPSAREAQPAEKLTQNATSTPSTTPAQMPSTSYVPQPSYGDHSQSLNTAAGDASIAATSTVKKSDMPSSTVDTSSHKTPNENQSQLDSVQQMVSDLGKIMNSEKSKPSSLGELKTVPYIDPSLETWARNLASKEAALRNREAYADQKDAELWRRESDLHNAESRTSGSNGGGTGSPEKLAAGIKDDGSKSAIKLKQDAIAETNASPTGLTLTPDKLSQIDKAGLKELGVNINEPFIISIKLNGKLIHVRVSKITANGKTFLAPNLNDDNREVKEVVLKSPVFTDFRQYYQQLSLQLKRHSGAM